jgi:hypothetical protein
MIISYDYGEKKHKKRRNEKRKTEKGERNVKSREEE